MEKVEGAAYDGTDVRVKALLVETWKKFQCVSKSDGYRDWYFEAVLINQPFVIHSVMPFL